MKNSLYLTVVFISLIVLASGCKKSYILSNKQMILFQYEYINHAWGYQHSGFYIDSYGKILIYEKPEGWNFGDAYNVLSSESLYENLERCTISEKTIALSELSKYSRHIENIASSEVTAPKNAGADFGSVRFVCYRYDEMNDTYRGYLIKMEGDFTCENLNFYAKKVSSWLKEIGAEIKIK